MSGSRAIKTILDLDGAFARVTTVEDYRALLTARIRARRVKRDLPQPQPLYADIDCGMWSARCECGSGIALHPEWAFAACLNCGKTWTQVVFPAPAVLDEVCRVLDLRPNGKRSSDRFYSWWHEESVADLIAENQRYGWPVPEAT